MSERTRIFTQLVCEWLIKPDTIPRMKVDASKKCSLRGVGVVWLPLCSCAGGELYIPTSLPFGRHGVLDGVGYPS